MAAKKQQTELKTSSTLRATPVVGPNKGTISAVKKAAKRTAVKANSALPGRSKTTKTSKVAALTTQGAKKSGVKLAPGKDAKRAPAVPAIEPKSPVTAKKPATAASPGAGLGPGDQVPVFEAVDQDGKLISNRDWAGAPFVLYFYPKDDTPGCTTQACGFRDELTMFEGLGVRIVGCSPDSPSAHTRFAQKYSLGFTLVADSNKELAQLFGVWKLKQNYGREYMGVERSTFLIDRSGKIVREWRRVRVAGHVPSVLQAVRDLVAS